MNSFKDARHLFHFAGLFVLAFLAFWAVRGFIVPRTFGQFGHYRAAAMGDVAAHPMKFAGHETCETCHSDVADVKAKGRHAHVTCEACHGAIYQKQPVTDAPKPSLYQRLVGKVIAPIPPDPPILKHADDPATVVPQLPDTKVLCARCHTATAAKPKSFPQVNPEEHSNGMPCKTCHDPHSPAMDTAASGGAK